MVHSMMDGLSAPILTINCKILRFLDKLDQNTSTQYYYSFNVCFSVIAKKDRKRKIIFKCPHPFLNIMLVLALNKMEMTF